MLNLLINEIQINKISLLIKKEHHFQMIYYLYSDTDSPWNDLRHGSGQKFAFDSDELSWDGGTAIHPDSFTSDPIMGLIELKIPLSDLNLEDGGEFKIKIYWYSSHCLVHFILLIFVRAYF